MRCWCCIREKDSVIVTILYNRANNKYQFVNLTHGHICKCEFNSIQDAIMDMENEKQKGILLDYKEIK